MFIFTVRFSRNKKLLDSQIKLSILLLFSAQFLSAQLCSAQSLEVSFNANEYMQYAGSNNTVVDKFSWPDSSAFEDTYLAVDQAKPIPIMRGTLIKVHGKPLKEKLDYSSWQHFEQSLSLLQDQESPSVEVCTHANFAFFKKGDKWKSQAIGNDNCHLYLPELNSLPSAPSDLLVSDTENAVTVFAPEKIWVSNNMERRLWSPWVYTTTLMTLEKPLYRTPTLSPLLSQAEWKKYDKQVYQASKKLMNIIQADNKKSIRKIRAMLEKPILPSVDAMQKAAMYVEKAGHLDLAVEFRSRFQPVGRCSMDTLPQTAARDYAELCYKKGDLACFLNLQVRVMAQNFERVAYSSYGERVHLTEAERLQSIGIDMGKFLKGLIFQFNLPSEYSRESISTWRLARSIVEADLVATFTPFLRDIALDPSIDEYNRLRASEVWVYSTLYSLEQPEDQSAQEIKSWLTAFSTEPLSEVTSDWLEGLRADF